MRLHLRVPPTHPCTVRVQLHEPVQRLWAVRRLFGAGHEFSLCKVKRGDGRDGRDGREETHRARGRARARPAPEADLELDRRVLVPFSVLVPVLVLCVRMSQYTTSNKGEHTDTDGGVRAAALAAGERVGHARARRGADGGRYDRVELADAPADV